MNKIEKMLIVEQGKRESRPPKVIIPYTADRPFTVRRLENLKKGEKVCFYQESMRRDTGSHPEPYASLLQTVFTVAKKLEALGRIKLTETRVKIPKVLKDGVYNDDVVQHWAEGLK